MMFHVFVKCICKMNVLVKNWKSFWENLYELNLVVYYSFFFLLLPSGFSHQNLGGGKIQLARDCGIL